MVSGWRLIWSTLIAKAEDPAEGSGGQLARSGGGGLLCILPLCTPCWALANFLTAPASSRPGGSQ